VGDEHHRGAALGGEALEEGDDLRLDQLIMILNSIRQVNVKAGIV
jgi:hypothetical protein